eukprot:TRINITY_DN15053_c0_g1_i1.p1 TRINITY_DN15053_c0_g1~~TRINITY_DN15053_c0_g1_i1.p1  ORF type:complete len:239 (-),score=51.67 TRINITY_DN15053_c0_g1_i1:81-797(-)
MDDPFNLFEIKEQPNPVQRKSFKTEGRYISPNPVISIKEKYTNSNPYNRKITSGVVSVELVKDDGSKIMRKGRNSRSDVLEASGDEGLHQFLKNLQATFRLRVNQNSTGSLFKLKFVVTYIDEEMNNHQEIIYSDPFEVSCSSRKKPRTKQNPSNNFVDQSNLVQNPSGLTTPDKMRIEQMMVKDDVPLDPRQMSPIPVESSLFDTYLMVPSPPNVKQSSNENPSVSNPLSHLLSNPQ